METINVVIFALENVTNRGSKFTRNPPKSANINLIRIPLCLLCFSYNIPHHPNFFNLIYLFERDVPMTPYHHLRSQHCNASWRGQFMYIAQLAPHTTFNTFNI